MTAVRQASQDAEETSPPPPWDRRSLNLPNLITISRLLLAFVLFALIDAGSWWLLSAVIFLVAATTDFLDGYLARAYGMVTVLGRILDPFVDKIIVCGAFIFLLSEPDCGITAWMTFLVIAREMFVTSLRSVLEQQGQDFSAKWSGKLKMVVQCTAVTVCLLSLSPGFRSWITDHVMSWSQFELWRAALLWGMVALTVYSGLEYMVRGFGMLRRTQRGVADG